MARLATLLVVAACALPLAAQEKIPNRYGIEAVPDLYPQKTPQDTLRSVLKAIEAKKIDYVLAHLAEPTYVDERVKNVGGQFSVMVEEVKKKLEAGPEVTRDMRKFLTDGEWKIEETTAVGSAKDVKGKQIFLKKIGNRWHLENRTQPAKDPAP